MLPDPAQPLEAVAHDARGIMIAIASEVADCHLGVRNGCLDQPFDLARGHCHLSLPYRFEASMICRRASISLFLRASATFSSSQSTPAEVRSPSTLQITSCSPEFSKSERTTSLA